MAIIGNRVNIKSIGDDILYITWDDSCWIIEAQFLGSKSTSCSRGGSSSPRMTHILSYPQGVRYDIGAHIFLFGKSFINHS